tara:strand:+ start:1757 stop:2041 length:285 start_codon:yes stop_codon:yes gene_type:complete
MINVVQMVPPAELNWSTPDHPNAWTLRTIIVNENQITSITPCDHMLFLLSQGKLPSGLHEAQQFSKINFSDGREIIAVGTPNLINDRVKKVLHG